jgi:4-amino-4-deoxychorismate lyase
MLKLDEGYMFGLGAFETIAVCNNHPILLSYHLERLEKALQFFNIEQKVSEQQVTNFLLENPLSGNGVLKIMVSKENVTFTTRDNHYQPSDYEKGFTLDFSKVKRNETSPLVFHKTMNYGDNILEKRLATKRGIDEPIFVNTKNEICEGACSNLFFVKDGKIFTPRLSCGLLAGTMRRYVMANFEVQETIITPEMIDSFEEIFLTNALMGIMPVAKWGEYTYSSHKVTTKILNRYQEDVAKSLI